MWYPARPSTPELGSQFCSLVHDPVGELLLIGWGKNASVIVFSPAVCEASPADMIGETDGIIVLADGNGVGPQ